jgi:PEP-CTERM motif-containing protein
MGKMKMTSRVIGLAALSLLLSLGSVPTASAVTMVTIDVTGVDFRFDGTGLFDIPSVAGSPVTFNGAPAEANAATSVTYTGPSGPVAPTQTAGVYMDISLPISSIPTGTTTVAVANGAGIFDLLLPIATADGSPCSVQCWGLALDITSYTVTYIDGMVDFTFTAGVTSQIFNQNLPGFAIFQPVTFSLSGVVTSSTNNDRGFLTSFLVQNGAAQFTAGLVGGDPVAPVPEPGMTLLLGLGLVGAGIIARKRAK